MKKIVLAALFSVILTASANAQVLYDSIFASPLSGAGQEGANLIQNFETFTLGSGIQNGWTGFNGGAGVGFNIENTGVAGFGSRTARHYSDASAFAGFEMNSPQVAAATGVLAGDVIISATNNVYQFVTTNVPAGFFNTRVQFEANGTITALQIAPPFPPCTTGVFSPTIGTWAPNVKMRIAVQVPGDGTLKVYKDGTQIFAGVDIASACASNNTGITDYRTFSPNTAGSAGTNYMIDNISDQIPEPASLSLLALGSLLMLRRKR